MKEKGKEAPKCPCCREELARVHENVFETYDFDPESGTYSLNEYAGDAEIKCPNCGCNLYDVFPDGPCNYGR